MPSVVPPHHSARNPQTNPVLCASAAARLLWAVGALLLLWATVLWALD